MEKERHIKAIGIISIIYGILFFIIGGILALSVFGFDSHPPVIIFMLLLFLVFVVPFVYIILGMNIMHHKNWARKTLIVLSIINLLNFPIGTAIGVYFLIILFDEKVKSIMK